MPSPSTEITCRACGHPDSVFIQTGTVIGSQISYYECDNCGYVQTEEPHWLTEAYNSAINLSDTGIMARNLANARITLGTLNLLGSLGERVVDCAGGYGILVRLLRDNGVDAYWSDPYCSNLVARGFEHDGASATLVTAFEAFEHFVKPQNELERLLGMAPNLLLSTELIPQPTPQQKDWWYYGADHGQHIGFFRLRTLQVMARKAGKHLVSNGRSYHLFTDRRIHPLVWKLMVRLNRYVYFLALKRPTSKTWADHLTMAGRKHE